MIQPKGKGLLDQKSTLKADDPALGGYRGEGYEDQGWSSIWGAPAIMHHSGALMADHRFCRRDYFRFSTAPIFIGWVGPENVTPGSTTQKGNRPEEIVPSFGLNSYN